MLEGRDRRSVAACRRLERPDGNDKAKGDHRNHRGPKHRPASVWEQREDHDGDQWECQGENRADLDHPVIPAHIGEASKDETLEHEDDDTREERRHHEARERACPGPTERQQ
jgi:hypothetical protein